MLRPLLQAFALLIASGTSAFNADAPTRTVVTELAGAILKAIPYQLVLVKGFVNQTLGLIRVRTQLLWKVHAQGVQLLLWFLVIL